MKVILKLRWLLAVTGLILLSSSGFAAGAADFKYVTIYKAKPGRSAMYIQFTKLKDGTLMGVFRDSKIDEKGEYGKKGSPWYVPGDRIMCIRSADNGRTWTDEPVLIYQDKDNYAITSEGGLGYQAADGTILVPFRNCNIKACSVRYKGAGSRHWQFIARSKDNGKTWKCEPQNSGSPFYSNAWYNGIIPLNDGSLWMVGWCGSFEEEPKNEAEKRGGCVRIEESKDDGKTWSHYGYIGYDPARHEETKSMPAPSAQEENAVVQLPSGKILVIDRPLYA